MPKNSGYLDPLISPTYQDDGDAKIRRANINLIGFTVEDDPTNDALKITNSGGGGGGSVIALTDHAAFRALSSTPSDGTVIHFQSPPGTYVYDSTSGAGFDDDDNIVLKLTTISVGSAGRAYNASSAVLPTYAAYRLIGGLGLFTSYTILARSSRNDGGGGIFAYDSSDSTTPDNDGTVLVSGSKRGKRIFAGPIQVEWFGAAGDSTTGFDGTDDTAAINRAIVAAYGGTLRFGFQKVYRYRQLAADRNPQVVTRSGNALLAANHGFQTGDLVVLANTQNPSDPPGGLTEGNAYSVIRNSSGSVSLELFPGSGVVTLTSAGTGTHTLMFATGIQPHDDTVVDLNGSTLVSPTYANESNAIWRAMGRARVTLRSGRIIGSESLTGSLRSLTYTEGYGVRLQDCTDSHVVGIEGSQFWWDPFAFLGLASKCTIRESYGHHSRRNCLSVIGAKQLAIIKCEFSFPGDGLDPQDPQAGIDVEPESVGGASNADGILIDDTWCHDAVQGIIVQQGAGATRLKSVSLRKVRVDTCSLTGINISSVDRVTLSDVVANGVTTPVIQGAAAFGIGVSNCGDVQIRGAVTLDCTRGVYLGYNDGVSIDGCKLTGRFDALRATKQSVTPNLGTNRLIATGHGFIEGQALFYTTTGTIFNVVGNLVSVDTTFYVRNPTANDYQISATPTSSILVLNNAGSGVHTAWPSGEDCTGLTIAHTQDPVAFRTSRCSVSNLQVDEFSGDGMVLSVSTFAKVANVEIKNNGRFGLNISGAQGGQIDNWAISGNGREIDARYDDMLIQGGSDEFRIGPGKAKFHDRYNKGILGTVYGGPDDRVTLDTTTTNQQFLKDHFKDCPIQIVSGTGAGGGTTITAVAPIVAYDPVTRIARINSFAGTPPVAGSGYEIRWPNKVLNSIEIAAGSSGVQILDVDTDLGGPILDNGAGTRLRRLPPVNLVASPSDLSTSDWTASGFSSRSTDTLKENGATSVRFIEQVVAPYRTGIPTTIQVEVMSANRWAYVQLDSSHYANINANTGALGTVLGVTATTETLPDGWFRLSMYVGDGPNDDLRIYMANGDNSLSYSGDGASTIQLRDVRLTQSLEGGSGSSAGFVTTSRTLNGTAPIRIDGGASGSLASDRTISVSSSTTGTVGVVQLAGDLNGTGTTATAPTIGKLTGLSGQVTVNAASFAFGSAVANPTIQQDSPGSGNGAVMTMAAQDGAASGSTNGGDLRLKGGRKNSSGTEGNVVLYSAGSPVASFQPTQVLLSQDGLTFDTTATAPVISCATAAASNGATVQILAGDGNGTNKSGGQLILAAGQKTGLGFDGTIYFKSGASFTATMTGSGTRLGDGNTASFALELASGDVRIDGHSTAHFGRITPGAGISGGDTYYDGQDAGSGGAAGGAVYIRGGAPTGGFVGGFVKVTPGGISGGMTVIASGTNWKWDLTNHLTGSADTIVEFLKIIGPSGADRLIPLYQP